MKTILIAFFTGLIIQGTQQAFDIKTKCSNSENQILVLNNDSDKLEFNVRAAYKTGEEFGKNSLGVFKAIDLTENEDNKDAIRKKILILKSDYILDAKNSKHWVENFEKLLNFLEENKNPEIPKLYSCVFLGKDDFYILQEFVGKSFSNFEISEKLRNLPSNEILSRFLPLINSLEKLKPNDFGISQIKPGNIWATNDELTELKLLDIETQVNLPIQTKPKEDFFYNYWSCKKNTKDDKIKFIRHIVLSLVKILEDNKQLTWPDNFKANSSAQDCNKKEAEILEPIKKILKEKGFGDFNGKALKLSEMNTTTLLTTIVEFNFKIESAKFEEILASLNNLITGSQSQKEEKLKEAEINLVEKNIPKKTKKKIPQSKETEQSKKSSFSQKTSADNFSLEQQATSAIEKIRENTNILESVVLELAKQFSRQNFQPNYHRLRI